MTSCYTITRKVENNGEIVETMMGLPIKRVVFDKMMNKAQRAYIFEGDFLAKGDLDLDWEFLASEAINNKDVVNAKLDLTDIVYEVFFGDGVIPGVGAYTHTRKDITAVRRPGKGPVFTV